MDPEQAAAIERTLERLLLQADRADRYPASVTVEDVWVEVDDGSATALVRYRDARLPGERLGGAWTISPDIDGGSLAFDAYWIAGLVSTYLGELAWAGGDPRLREPDPDGVRWHREIVP